MKAVLDEMLPPAIAEGLRARGHDVIAVSERADLRSLDDPAQLAAATREGRVIVTRDVADYLGLDRDCRAATREHAGIVLVTDRFAPDAVGPLVKELDELLKGPAPYPSFVHWL